MEAVFSEDALDWLKKAGFSEDEAERARKILSIAWRHYDEGREATLRLPKETTARVAALVYAALTVTDVEGRPMAFGTKDVIGISEGTRKAFEEEMEIGSYEDIMSKTAKLKFGRGMSDPRSRTSVKKERYRSI